jgi:nucleoside 2-deoxyribosyltransferase
VADRYDSDVEPKYQAMKEICNNYGLEAVTPLDQAPGVEKIITDNPYTWATNVLDNYQQHVRNCDIIIADLNDFRGYELSNDVGFECGMGFQLGKKLYGYMDNTDHMIYRIPHLGKDKEFRDQTGSNVENFNYPANLMFACSMKIFEGNFEEIIKKVVEDLK